MCRGTSPEALPRPCRSGPKTRFGGKLTLSGGDRTVKGGPLLAAHVGDHREASSAHHTGPMPAPLRRAVAAAVLAGTLLAAGTLPAAGSPHGASASAHPTTADQHKAKALVKHLLSLTVLPPGAIRTAHLLPGATPKVAQTMSSPGTTHTVSVKGYWRVPMAPSALWQWVRTHAEPGGQLGDENDMFTGVATPCAAGRVSADQTVDFPAPSGIGQAELDVQVGACQVSGQTPVVVVAEATWRPVRPADSYVPTGVGAVTVAYVSSEQGGVQAPHAPALAGPRTVTEPSKVAALVRYADAMEVSLPVWSCPPPSAQPILSVEFRSSAHGAVLASMRENVGCTFGYSFLEGHRSVVSLVPGVHEPTFPEEVREVTGLVKPTS